MIALVPDGVEIPDEGLSFGPYTLLRHLSRGGMADIFLARSEVGRPVVVKRIRAAVARDPHFVRLFHREASIAMHLAHGNVAQVFDFGETGGEYYLAMEWIDGPSLLEVMQRAAQAGEAVPFPLAAFVLAEVARGLDHAHHLVDDAGRSMGIVHRDVTPQNILLTYDGEVKLVDFGIARGRTTETLTRPGVARGKYAYFSPEQVRDRPLDARSDLYACGVVLYRMLTSRLPFEGAQVVDVLRAIVEGGAPTPRAVDPAVPEPLESIALRAMALEPTRRYGRARDLEADLVGWLRAEAPEVGGEVLAAWLRRLFGGALEASGRRLAPLDAHLATLAPWSRPLPAADAPEPHEEGPTGLSRLGRRRRGALLAGGAALALALGVGALVLRHAAAPPAPELVLASEPPGAAIRLDGADTGRLTPARLPAPAADRAYGVTLSRAGYRPWMGSARPGTPLTVRLDPEPDPAAAPEPGARAPTRARTIVERFEVSDVALRLHRTRLEIVPVSAAHAHRVTVRGDATVAARDETRTLLWYAMRPSARDRLGLLRVPPAGATLRVPKGASGVGLALLDPPGIDAPFGAFEVRVDDRKAAEMSVLGSRIGPSSGLPGVRLDPARRWRLTVRLEGDLGADPEPTFLWLTELEERGSGETEALARAPYAPTEAVGSLAPGGSATLPLASRVFVFTLDESTEDDTGHLEVRLEDVGESALGALRREPR